MPEIKSVEDLGAFLCEQVMHADYYIKRVNRMLEILMGDLFERHPGTIEGFLLKHGHSQEQIDDMKPEQIIQALRKAWAEEPDHFKNVIVALDLLFEARYGWPQGTARKLTPAEAYLALEHATEFDAPGKASIWETTK